MDKAQTDINTAQDEIQLADILKPSTLIIALVTFVLIILFGWYVYVLKPALSENESMIHFMESHHQENIEQINLEKATINNTSEKSLQPVPESSLATLNAGEPSDKKIEQNKPAKNKTVKSIKHKSHEHQHALKSTVTAHKTSRSAGNSSECSQAQIALHQCL